MVQGTGMDRCWGDVRPRTFSERRESIGFCPRPMKEANSFLFHRRWSQLLGWPYSGFLGSHWREGILSYNLHHPSPFLIFLLKCHGQGLWLQSVPYHFPVFLFNSLTILHSHISNGPLFWASGHGLNIYRFPKYCKPGPILGQGQEIDWTILFLQPSSLSILTLTCDLVSCDLVYIFCFIFIKYVLKHHDLVTILNGSRFV